MVAVEWADGCDNVGLVASVDILSLSLSLSLFPWNQASIGLILWWSSWFDVVDRGGAMVVDRGCAVVCGSRCCCGWPCVMSQMPN